MKTTEKINLRTMAKNIIVRTMVKNGEKRLPVQFDPEAPVYLNLSLSRNKYPLCLSIMPVLLDYPDRSQYYTPDAPNNRNHDRYYKHRQIGFLMVLPAVVDYSNYRSIVRQRIQSDG